MIIAFPRSRQTVRRSKPAPAAALLIVLSLLLTACGGILTPTPTPTRAATATRPLPTAVPPTATPAPLGSPQNPFLIGVVTSTQAPQPTGLPATPTSESQPTSSAGTQTPGAGVTPSPTAQPTPISGASDQLASLLSDKTGLTVKTAVFAGYPELLEALKQKQVQAAWLPPLTYLHAYQNGTAQVGLVTNHFGVYAYGTNFMANVADGYTVYFDSSKNQSTADAADALRQLAGKTPCWVDQSSPSGYILPKGVLAVESIQTGPEVITQDHSAVIRALYTRGICDFGATFGIVGDQRTASAIQNDMPDVSQKVLIIWQTPAVIPNLNFSYAWDLPQSYRAKLNDSLVNLAHTKDGLAAMSATTAYQVDGLKSVDNGFYNDLMFYVQASGVDLNTTIGK